MALSDQSDSEREPEIVVNGKLVGYGYEGLLTALRIMAGPNADRPASDEVEQR